MTTMWMRICCSQLKAQALALAQTSCRSASINPAIAHSADRSLIASSPFAFRHFSADSSSAVKKNTVEDVMPIATGHEREQLESYRDGRDILEIIFHVGPFGTKEEPAIIKSCFDKIITECCGGEDEDEHNPILFRLEKGKPHECPECSQYFVLEVVGPGGSPDGHVDDDHHH